MCIKAKKYFYQKTQNIKIIRKRFLKGVLILAEKYIMAIDEGTTSTRAMIIDHEGKEVASSQKEFPQYFPEPGWVEHNAEEIWTDRKSVV